MKSMDTLEETGSFRSPSHATDDNKDARRTLRIGIVGCGRVAAYHLGFISKVSGASIVGLADKDETAARRLAKSHNVSEVYSSLEEMLEQSPPDIVHILTPPFLHYSQASTAIERGVHVLVEKPVTLRARETDELYRLAADRGVSLCPDFIQLFHPAFSRRALSSSPAGSVGSSTWKAISVRSWTCLNCGKPGPCTGPTNFPAACCITTSLTHCTWPFTFWVIFEDYRHAEGVGCLASRTDGSSGRIARYGRRLGACGRLPCDEVSAHLFRERLLRKGRGTINFDTSTVLVTGSGMMPRSLDRATSNFRQAAQLSGSGLKNIFDFLRGRLVPYQGLQELIPRFYESVRTGSSTTVSQELTPKSGSR